MKRLLILAAVVLGSAIPASAGGLPILASHDWWPVYSPDAQWVAFTRVNGQGRQFELDVAPAGGGRVRQLARASSQLGPAWSPGSDELAYQAGGGVYTIARNGSDRRYVAVGGLPDWSPDGVLAYVRGGALHVASTILATELIAAPDWSPDGRELAFARSNGIFVVTLDGSERTVATTVGEPSAPVWSYDGKKIAYTAGAFVHVVAAVGASPPSSVAGPYAAVGRPSWAPTGDALVYTADGHLDVTWLSSPPQTDAGPLSEVGSGASFSPGDLNGYLVAFSGPLPGCPGHSGIQIGGGPVLSGSCTIGGTPQADVIQGTSLWGDVILAGRGNDRIHANDGHTDRVACGPGRDTVWADRSDRLTGCEIVHR